MEIISNILRHFKIPDQSYQSRPFHQGLINDTYFIESGNRTLYVLQRVNEEVFQNVEALMHNLRVLLPYLGAVDYHKLAFVPTINGHIFFRSSDAGTWRMMHYVNDSKVHNICDDRTVAFEAGRILGRFHCLVPAPDSLELKETLIDFHNLERRLEQYNEALDSGDELRRHQALPTIEFVQQSLAVLREAPLEGLPLRICHNDTKLNNVLFTMHGKGLCLIDLDTLMPGYFFYDFGDLARTVVNPAAENEKDLDRIGFSLEMFESLVAGLFSVGNFLTASEIRGLPWAVAYMPFIHGIRALTDYLMGDLYYKVSYSEENLDRARSLLHFAGLALRNLEQMRDLISFHSARS